MTYALIVDSSIVPMVSAQQIAWSQHHEKNDPPPSLEDALTDFDQWLESGDVTKMTEEERERMQVWGMRG